MNRIYTYPHWPSNPYQNLLYLEAQAHGWKVSGRERFEHFLADVKALGPGDVLHIHWTSPIGAGVRSATEYARRIDRFDEALRGADERGVLILWTVHNAVAHDTRFLDDEIRVAQILTRWSTRIITLNSRTAEAVSDYYELPAGKIYRIPHSSYKGVYPRISQVEARAKLGIRQNARVVGFTGAIRPYKGVGDFLSALNVLRDSVPKLEGILAGDTSQWAMREVEAAMPRELTVHRKHNRLTDAELTAWTTACDVVVLPFRRILNSGSLMLAATCGVPCVLPGEPHLIEEYGGEPWVAFFNIDDADRVEAITDATKELLSRNMVSSRASAEKFAGSYTPFDMSKDFWLLLDSLTRSGTLSHRT